MPVKGGLPLVLLLGVILNPGCPGPTPPPNENGTVDNDNGTIDDPIDPPPDDIVDDPDPPVDDGPRDSDGDGFSDHEEINGIPGTDPLDPTDNPDNVRDSDGDGCSDFDETNFLGFCDGNPNTPPDAVIPPGDLVTISGTVLVGVNSVIDGDNNDPTNPVMVNEGVATEQSIPNPCTLGGYLGNTRHGVDDSDVYRVQMAEGQAATLFVATPQANDFDLFLYDETGTALASSEGVDRAELVTAPNNGTFLIEVFGYSVANFGDPGGLYTLAVGENALGGAAFGAHARRHLSSLYEFAEGELIVKWRDGLDRNPKAKVDSELGLEPIADGAHTGGFQRVRLSDVTPVAKVATSSEPSAGDLRRPSSATIAAIKQLRRRADVVNADPNYIRRPTATPNDEFYPFQWHYPQINLPAAWDITTGAAGVVVAVIDTGVVLDHPDLQGQLVAGYDFISDPDNARDGDGIDPDPDDPGDLALQGRSTFHGTHVAGTVAARTNNGSGVAGVAWNSRIMPVRVLGRLGGLDSDIVQGIRYAAGLSNDSGTVPAQPAAVINMSLGGPGSSPMEQAAITAARDAGAIVVVAAGNEQSNASFFSPAGAEGVVTVSAIGLARELAPYSNFGEAVEVAAPGGDLSADVNADTLPDGVLSAVGDDGGGLYSLAQGTSMAAPHVSGVLALMKAVNPSLSPLDVDLLLASTHPATSLAIVDDLGTPGRDNSFGYGLINALSAVRAAEEMIGAASVERPILQLVPGNLDFASDLSSGTVTVSNGGVGTLEVTAVTVDQPWLSVSPSQGGAGTYAVTVDRGGLADGVYSGGVEFVSNGGTLPVSVRMVVGVPYALGGDIGTVYVLLVNRDTLQAAGQDNITADDAYVFTLPNVPPGDYLLFAGTDLNDDSFVGDPGEAFGGFPTLLDPAVLDATRDRSGLSLNVSFDINIQAPEYAETNGVQARSGSFRKSRARETVTKRLNGAWTR